MASRRKSQTVEVRPGQDIELKFAGRPIIIASHLKERGNDRTLIAMPVPNEGPEVPFLILSQSLNGGNPIHQAIYTIDGEEKAFIGTANEGSGALFLLIDGKYRRLDFDMLEQFLRDSPSFGELMPSPDPMRN